MKRDQVLKKAGIVHVIKTDPAAERSKRAQGRVLAKLADKPRHATALSVLERTELRTMEADKLIAYHPGKSLWMLPEQLERELGPHLDPNGVTAQLGALEHTTFTAKKLEPMPAPNIVGNPAAVAGMTDAAIIARAPMPDTKCPECGEHWVSFTGCTTTTCTPCVRKRHRIDTFELRRRGEDA